MSSSNANNTLLETIDAAAGLTIEVWSLDFAHAVNGHPEVTLDKIRKTLNRPSKVIQSNSSTNVCLFYSIEFKVSETEYLYFCVVVGVKKSGRGRVITAYNTDYIKTGILLYEGESKK